MGGLHHKKIQICVDGLASLACNDSNMYMEAKKSFCIAHNMYSYMLVTNTNKIKVEISSFLSSPSSTYFYLLSRRMSFINFCYLMSVVL